MNDERPKTFDEARVAIGMAVLALGRAIRDELPDPGAALPVIYWLSVVVVVAVMLAGALDYWLP